MSWQNEPGEELLSVAEVREKTGLTARTLRYYEEVGLLPGARRRELETIDEDELWELEEKYDDDLLASGTEDSVVPGIEEFLADEEAYCDRFGLSDEQKRAIRERNVLDLIALGGNSYYLAKFTGMFGWNMQDIGAQQTGMSLEDFKAMLVRAGE